jgi:Spy/CpxP family protein refolding chaperone
MKNRSQLKLIVAAAILCSAITTSFGQPKPEQRPERPQAGGVGMRSVGSGFAFVYNVLTEEQRESLRQVSEGQREKIRALEEKLRDARKAIIEVSVGENINEDVIRKKFMDAAKIDADLTVLRAKALSQVKPPLSKEQIEKLKNPPMLEGGAYRGRLGDREQLKPIEPGRDKNDLPPAPKQ